MRPCTFASCLAFLASSASAIDVCRLLGCFQDSDSPAVTVTLNVPFQNDLMKTTIRVDLYESDKVCDPSHVEVFGQPLPVDADGRGSGPLRVAADTFITAHWEFSCVTPEDASTEHKLHFTVDSINDLKVQETDFVARFRQTMPIIFTAVQSSHFANEPSFSQGTLHYASEGSTPKSSKEDL